MKIKYEELEEMDIGSGSDEERIGERGEIIRRKKIRRRTGSVRAFSSSSEVPLILDRTHLIEKGLQEKVPPNSILWWLLKTVRLALYFTYLNYPRMLIRGKKQRIERKRMRKTENPQMMKKRKILRSLIERKKKTENQKRRRSQIKKTRARARKISNSSCIRN